MIHTEPALLHALYRTGISKEAVNARAARLGLTNEFIKRCRLTGIRPSLRKCIKCDASFLSVAAMAVTNCFAGASSLSAFLSGF